MVSLTLAIVGLLTTGVSHASFGPVLLVGQITDARTGEPIEQVRVVLEGERVLTLTNSQGGFHLQASAPQTELELTLRHPCYHTVRVAVGSGTPTRRIRLGMPFDYEKYDGVSRPLGGCR